YYLDMGRVWYQYVWYDYQTSRAPHVCCGMVLHRHLCDGSRAAYCKLYPITGILLEELLCVCWGTGCLGAMVVWSYCRRILLDHARSGNDVLLPAQDGKPTRLLLQIEYSPFLVFDLYLHLGWTTPLVVHILTVMGTIVGRRVLCYVNRTIVGRDDQWFVDPTWGMGQSADGAYLEIYGCRFDSLRYGYF